MSNEVKQYFAEINRLTNEMKNLNYKIKENYNNIDKLGFKINVPVYDIIYGNINTHVQVMENWNNNTFLDLK